MLKSNDLFDQPTFLIDTGAEISLIKLSKLRSIVKIFTDGIIILKGINNTENPYQSLGYCYLNFKIGTHSFHHIFHIVPDTIGIKQDGILGSDFLDSTNSCIDFGAGIIFIGNKALPLLYNSVSREINDQKEAVKIKVKARTETVIPIYISNPSIKQGIVPNKEIEPDVYLCSSLVSVKDNKAITTLLNSTDEDLLLEIPIVNLEPLDLSPHTLKINKKDLRDYQSSRVDEILKVINKDGMNSEEYDAIKGVISQFSEIFYLDGDILSATDLIEHEIHTETLKPTNDKNYRFPQSLRGEVSKQISNMLEQGIIKPSISPWNAPVWVVPKKTSHDGKTNWRVVIDYRALNEKTIGDATPLPNIEETLEQLGGAKYFSTLDCVSGFHQIKMHPRDAPKTAFSVPEGHFEFTRMPFGLKNSPATFQRLMRMALTGLINNFRV